MKIGNLNFRGYDSYAAVFDYVAAQSLSGQGMSKVLSAVMDEIDPVLLDEMRRVIFYLKEYETADCCSYGFCFDLYAEIDEDGTNHLHINYIDFFRK